MAGATLRARAIPPIAGPDAPCSLDGPMAENGPRIFQKTIVHRLRPGAARELWGRPESHGHEGER